MNSDLAAVRRSWVVFFVAYLGALVAYGVVALLAHQAASRVLSPNVRELLRTILPGLAAVCIAASIVSLPRSLVRIAVPPHLFLRRTIIALTLAEGSAVAGLAGILLGVFSVANYAFSGLAAALVMVLWILPRGNAYWRLQRNDRHSVPREYS